jgi:hypothetical protein
VRRPDLSSPGSAAAGRERGAVGDHAYGELEVGIAARIAAFADEGANDRVGVAVRPRACVIPADLGDDRLVRVSAL